MATGEISNEQLLPKWEHSKQRGKLERRRLGSHGQKIHELYNPKLGIINKYEDFVDASRYTIHLRQETDGSDLSQFHKEAISKNFPFEVSFNDRNGKSTTTIESPSNEIGVNVLLGANSSTRINELEANVSLAYSEDSLTKCVIQAEKPYFNDSENLVEQITRIEARGLAENIKYLVNAIKTTSPDILHIEKTINEQFAQDDIGKFSPDSPAVAKAEALVSRAIDDLLKSIPLDDRKEYGDSLNKIAFSDLLLHEILIHTKGNDDDATTIVEIGIKKLLALTLADACGSIDNSNESNMKEFQRLFQIDKFGETAFSWRDIEKEIKIDFEADQARNMDVKQEASTNYGEKIDIQDHSYLVTKDNNQITVVCMSNRGRGGWTAVFPIYIPVKQIKDIINDTSADFRKVKSLVSASLKS